SNTTTATSRDVAVFVFDEKRSWKTLLEAAFLEIHERLHDFLLGVHHERTVARHRLAQRSTRDEDQSRFRAGRRHLEHVAAAEHRQFVRTQLACAVTVANRRFAFEDIRERAMPPGQGKVPARSRV